jgi:hypothetical protein
VESEAPVAKQWLAKRDSVATNMHTIAEELGGGIFYSVHAATTARDSLR